MTQYSTTQYLVALLDAYKIRTIVASPGMQNAKFNAILQNKSNFKCFSVVDERSAAYLATGYCFEYNEPVVISCTGATSSRNYLPGMTEAFYRKIPVIAITFYNPNSSSYNLSPQYVDRSVTQNDVKYMSINLPVIHGDIDKRKVIIEINCALSAAKYLNLPVHINCPCDFDFSNIKSLPNDVWYPIYTNVHSTTLSDKLVKISRFAVFIGSHHKFNKELEQAISNFAEAYDIPVICDHTSQYKGKNKVLISQIVSQIKSDDYPNLLIDIGGISGEYLSEKIYTNTKVWRISEDGKLTCRFNKKVELLIHGDELSFFKKNIINKNKEKGYYCKIKDLLDFNNSLELPFSNAFVAQQTSLKIPKNSTLHLAILNSLRCMNHFNLDDSIDVNCNVGGFGIDGPVSSVIGQSLPNQERLSVAIIGDLAFFYDMNILGNRHIGKNVRLIIINNNKGEEFILNKYLEQQLGSEIEPLIAAAGHYLNGVKNWALSSGFKYFSAQNKNQFNQHFSEFISPNLNSSAIFEIFTSDKDEKEALDILNRTNNLETKKSNKIRTISFKDKIVSILRT